MDIWPWAFIIGIKIINLKPILKYHLADPINNNTVCYKHLPVFIPKINPKNSRIFC